MIDRFLTDDLRDQWAKVPGAPKRDLRADEHRSLGVTPSVPGPARRRVVWRTYGDD